MTIQWQAIRTPQQIAIQWQTTAINTSSKNNGNAMANYKNNDNTMANKQNNDEQQEQ